MVRLSGQRHTLDQIPIEYDLIKYEFIHFTTFVVYFFIVSIISKLRCNYYQCLNSKQEYYSKIKVLILRL